MEDVILGSTPFLYPMFLSRGRNAGRSFSLMGRRHYDPTVGRFLEPDSAQWLDPRSFGGINAYAYCLNDPIAKEDPNGRFGFVASVVLGAIFALGTTVIKDWVDDGKPFNGSVNWKEYVGSILGGTIAGLGSGFISTVAANAMGNLVQSVIEGNVKSFGDFFKFFGLGAVIGAAGYAVTMGIQAIADRRIMGIIGSTSNKLKVNKRLAAAGFKDLKIGKIGFGGVYESLYKRLGFQALENSWEIIFDIGSGFLPIQ